MIDDDISKVAKRVLEACRTRGLKVVTAESCTGGLVAAALICIEMNCHCEKHG